MLGVAEEKYLYAYNEQISYIEMEELDRSVA
jgi:hypothetical protein